MKLLLLLFLSVYGLSGQEVVPYSVHQTRSTEALAPAYLTTPNGKQGAIFSAGNTLSTKWKMSVVTLLVTSSLDTLSSWNQQEANPILGKGTFGLRQATLKGGITGGAVLTEWLWLRRHPKDAKVLSFVNFSASGVTLGVSIHNWRLRGQ